MSLQIWLPLNGNLKNKGCSDLTFSVVSTNTTVNSSGKIGSCYSNDSFTAGGIYSNTTINLGQNQSMFCWFKFTSLNSSSTLGGGLVSQHRHTNNTGMGITIKYVSSTTGYLSVNTGTGSSRTYNTYCGTTLLQANTWYHGGYTYDGSTIRIYVNGVCEKEQAYTGMSVPADYITAFCWSFNTTSGSTPYTNYKFNGYLNDVRIYNHTLSLAEIKELSKGLVVHYKLDNDGRGNDNLVSKTNTTNTGMFGYSEQTGGSTKSIEYYNDIPCIKVVRNTTEHSGWGYLWHTGLATSLIKTSTTYTVSFDVLAGGDGYVTFNGFMQGNATNQMSASTEVVQRNFTGNKWSHIILRTTTKSSFESITVGAQVVYMDCPYMRNTEAWMMVKNMKVEEGINETVWIPYSTDDKYKRLGLDSLVVTDCSGHGYTATKSGSVTVDSSTPRYSLSTKFVSGSHVYTPALSTGGFTNTYTFSWWAKYTNYTSHMMWGFSNGNRLNLYMTGSIFCWNTGDGGSNTFNISAATYGDDNWHHFAVTGDGTTTKLYIDGEFKANAKTYKGITGTTIYMNGWDSGTGYNFNGQLSDFRLYATCLSADDIKRLYNTAASVAKNGAMLGYEVKEG